MSFAAGSVCIIPARGGSKRIPRKNIRPFQGRPVLHYAVEAARASGLFSRVIVSTDCPDIAREARRAGAQTPFVRPSRLADDHTVTVDVIIHALKELGEQGESPPATVCCLYPVTPLIQVSWLQEAHDLLHASGAPCTFPVTSFPAPVHRGMTRDGAGGVNMVWPEHRNTRSNDLPEIFHDAGQFYFWDTARFLDMPMLYPEGTLSIVLPRHMAQDIDTEEDWLVAERLYAAFRANDGGGAARAGVAA